MANIVEVPGFGRVEFPANMTDDQIAAAIQRNMAPAAPAAALQPLDEMSARFGTAAQVQPTPMPYGEQMARIGGALDDAARVVASGATLGGADRLAAFAGGRKLEDERARTAQSRERLGAAAIPLEVAGGVGSAIAMAPLMPSTWALSPAAGTLARSAVGAGEGAAIGAADAVLNRDQGSDVTTQAAIGGVIGGGVPMAIGAARRAVSPFANATVTPEQRRLLQIAQSEGIDLPAGAKTQNQVLKWMDAVTADLPAGQAARERTQRQFQGAVARRLDEAGDQLDPATLSQVARRIGGDMDRLLLQTQPKIDAPFRAAATDVLDDYASKPGSAQNTQLKRIIDDMLDRGRDPTPGEYVTARRRLASAADSADVDYANTAKALKTALDDMAERNMPAGLADEWRRARTQYYNLMRVREAANMSGEIGLAGGVSGPALNAAVKNRDRMAYSVGRGRGQDNMEDLGRLGGAFLKQMPNSGTAQRAAALGGLGVAGSTVGGIGGFVQSGDANSVTQSGIMGGIGAVGAGLAYRQPWAQRYLTNRVLAGPPSANANTIARAMQMGLLD